MCGIVALWDPKKTISVAARHNAAEAALNQMIHRGPDGKGIYSDENASLTLGHRRLSIVDLSSLGAQPMSSRDGTWVITFNGEVYNHRRLRREAQAAGLPLVGHSDTNVLLEWIAHEGLERALRRVEGVFAFALWNTKEQTLYLARDAFGEKPLAYGSVNGFWVATSEIRGVAALAESHDSLRAFSETSTLAQEAYFHFGYVPEPLSIYSALRKVNPGTIVRISDEGRNESIISLSSESDLVHSHSESLASVLVDTVTDELDADVAVGTLLSGGLDSTVVAAAAVESAKIMGRSAPVAITIGFSDSGFDESEHARKIASHLKLKHEVLFLNSKNVLDAVARLGKIYDEPFSDSSQIPTVLVYELAKSHAKVFLGGDGGDELFAGYNRHRWVEPIERVRSAIPSFIRSAGVTLLESKRINRAVQLGISRRFSLAEQKAEKLARFMSASNTNELFLQLYRQAQKNLDTTIDEKLVSHFLPESVSEKTIRSKVMAWDRSFYLTSDLLVKTDRASMAASIEARCPLLHPRVARWARMNRATESAHETKSALKAVLRSWVPEELWNRPKAGFAAPIDRWLRAELKDFCHSVLFDSNNRIDWIDSKELAKAWMQHQEGVNRSMLLWPAICFLQWQVAQASARKPVPFES